jgi:hypothetical protein
LHTARRLLPAALVAFMTGLAAVPMLQAAEPALPGRLFLTPAERRDLDEMRRRGPQATAAGGQGAADTTVVLNGVLHGGRSGPVVWVNGVQRTTAVGATAGRSDPGHSVLVAASGGSAAARLKPGQTWEPATGVVRDCVQCVAEASPQTAAASPEAGAADADGPGPAAATETAEAPESP